MQTLGGMLESTARAYPDKVAVIFKERQVTYGELDGLINRLAIGLSRHGIGRGDWVMELLPNGIDMIVSHFCHHQD